MLNVSVQFSSLACEMAASLIEIRILKIKHQLENASNVKTRQ